jgi:phosphatidylglycerophosphatase A
MDGAESNRAVDRWVVWVAQGGGIGRIRWAPGTFGSGLGLVWLAVLLTLSHPGWMLFAMAFSVAGSIWFCGRAEALLGMRDPGSVVLDEIVAIPVCFVAVLAWPWYDSRLFPGPEILVRDHNWLLTALTFGLFRLFDVWKPWPVGPSQRLPGGWGITIDDLLAAGYVNLVLILLHYGLAVSFR